MQSEKTRNLSKLSIALDIQSTLNSLISNKLNEYLCGDSFTITSFIGAIYSDFEKNIPFKIPNCSIVFNEKKIISITFPDKIDLQSDFVESSEIHEMLRNSSINLPFDLINFINQNQKNNIEKIIKNNVDALDLNGLSDIAIRAISKIMLNQSSIDFELSIIKETEIEYQLELLAKLPTQIDLRSVIAFKKVEITPYQSVFLEKWGCVSGQKSEINQSIFDWIINNKPDYLYTTEDLTRPVSCLHHKIKNFLIDNKKPV